MSNEAWRYWAQNLPTNHNKTESNPVNGGFKAPGTGNMNPPKGLVDAINNVVDGENSQPVETPQDGPQQLDEATENPYKPSSPLHREWEISRKRDAEALASAKTETERRQIAATQQSPEEVKASAARIRSQQAANASASIAATLRGLGRGSKSTSQRAASVGPGADSKRGSRKGSDSGLYGSSSSKPSPSKDKPDEPSWLDTAGEYVRTGIDKVKDFAIDRLGIQGPARDRIEKKLGQISNQTNFPINDKNVFKSSPKYRLGDLTKRNELLNKPQSVGGVDSISGKPPERKIPKPPPPKKPKKDEKEGDGNGENKPESINETPLGDASRRVGSYLKNLSPKVQNKREKELRRAKAVADENKRAARSAEQRMSDFRGPRQKQFKNPSGRKWTDSNDLPTTRYHKRNNPNQKNLF